MKQRVLDGLDGCDSRVDATSNATYGKTGSQLTYYTPNRVCGELQACMPGRTSGSSCHGHRLPPEL